MYVFLNKIFIILDFGELTELTSIDGEATANNRKAKLIFFYEWVLKGEWSGEWKLVYATTANQLSHYK